jgi:hypothetical protein
VRGVGSRELTLVAVTGVKSGSRGQSVSSRQNPVAVRLNLAVKELTIVIKFLNFAKRLLTC